MDESFLEVILVEHPQSFSLSSFSLEEDSVIGSDVTGQKHTKAYERHLLSYDLEPSILTVSQMNH